MTAKRCLTVIGIKDRCRVGIGPSNALRSRISAHPGLPAGNPGLARYRTGKQNGTRRLGVVGSLAALALGLMPGCGFQAGDLPYFWHLAKGQLKLVLNCKPIPELIREGSVDADLIERLQLVTEVKTYAFEVIGLAASENYSCFFDTQGKPVLWNASASPPDHFEPYQWHFPITGSVPYKGFFLRELAVAERDALRARGYDAISRPVAAYSTLGFFSDPVLSTMVQYPEDALADLIIHELTHSTIYVPGHTDFNESLATFVGNVGSLRFLEHRHGVESDAVANARARRADSELFRLFMQQVVADLDSLYNQQLPREHVLQLRVDLFRAWQGRFKVKLKEFSDPSRYRGFLDWEVNNALLLSYRRYHNRQGLFTDLYGLTGNDLRQSLELLKDAEEAGDPWEFAEDLLSRVRRLGVPGIT